MALCTEIMTSLDQTTPTRMRELVVRYATTEASHIIYIHYLHME
jgi:hypothetical protein